MLDYMTALDLMKKYGYTSTSVHPYIYKHETNIGVCYSLIDDAFGALERVAIFRTKEEMDDFLKKHQWFKQNGKEKKVTMALDNYESPSPNIIYYRNGHIMASDEMFNLEKYDNLEQQKKELNEVDRYVLEADTIMEVYNLIKEEQGQFAKHIEELTKEKREKYFQLQTLVDEYNHSVYDRKMLDVEHKDPFLGVNISIERSLKERLSQYKNATPERKEAMDFIEEVWNLSKALELNEVYFNNKKVEKELINDIYIANKKIEYMQSLLEQGIPFLLFKKDLQKAFCKLDKKLEPSLSPVLIDDDIAKLKTVIETKYSFYSKLEPLETADYLTEARQNNNYAQLSSKYAIKEVKVEQKKQMHYEEIIVNLAKQFKKLTIEEQNALILFFSDFQELFYLILRVENYSTLPIKTLLSALEKESNFQRYKQEYYENCKEALTLSSNAAFKKSIFSHYDFTSLETFIASCLKTIDILKNLEKMVLKSDALAYFVTEKYDTLNCPDIIMTITNMDALNVANKNENTKVILANLKADMKVLYADRIIDFGDKTKTATYSTKTRKENTIAFALHKHEFVKEEQPIVVAKFNSTPIKEDSILIVDKLNLVNKNTFYSVNVFLKENKNVKSVVETKIEEKEAEPAIEIPKMKEE